MFVLNRNCGQCKMCVCVCMMYVVCPTPIYRYMRITKITYNFMCCFVSKSLHVAFFAIHNFELYYLEN